MKLRQSPPGITKKSQAGRSKRNPVEFKKSIVRENFKLVNRYEDIEFVSEIQRLNKLQESEIEEAQSRSPPE